MESEKSAGANPPPYTGPPPAGPPPGGPQPVGAVPIPVATTSVTYVTNAAPAVLVPMQMVQRMGSKPSSYVCKSCNAEIITRTEANNSTKTHIFALVLCVFGLWCCACIPYCMDSCKNVDHYCPNCNAYIGTNRN